MLRALPAAHLLQEFRRLLPTRLLGRWMADCGQGFYLRAFTPVVTLWYCVFGRLCPNHCLSHVVEDARSGGADCLSPRGKRLSRQLRSEATASFSDARARLPLAIFEKGLRHIADRFAANFRGGEWFGLRVALMDGSTCRLRPFGDIARAFPPHRSGNAKNPPYWCLARVAGMFCLTTGAVIGSAVGPMRAGEQCLAAMLLRRCWRGWLIVADRNFGVHSVARAATAAGAHLLARLTRARAARLARLAGVRLGPGMDIALDWFPSRYDQRPDGLGPAPVRGRLLVVRIQPRGYRPELLCLFTTLADARSHPAPQLAELYGRRWAVEICLRHVKSQMDLGLLQCRSADMVRKEWLAGLIAYNLIRWAMAAAAAAANTPISLLSFSRSRELLLGWCRRWPTHRHSLRSWQLLLGRIAAARLPKRRKPRPSEPRAVRPFQKDCAKLFGDRATARLKLAATSAKS